MLDELLAQQRQILALASELDTLTKAPVPAVTEVARIRWKSSNLLGEYLLAQDRILHSLAARGLGHVEQAIFETYFSELVGLRLSNADHTSRWDFETIKDDWKGYRKAARAQIDMLHDRAAWEEQFLFPVLHRLVSNDAEERLAA